MKNLVKILINKMCLNQYLNIFNHIEVKTCVHERVNISNNLKRFKKFVLICFWIKTQRIKKISKYASSDVQSRSNYQSSGLYEKIWTILLQNYHGYLGSIIISYLKNPLLQILQL